MAAPVLSGEPEKIAMTAPVLQETGAGGEQVVSFIAPAEYTTETLPVPKDPRIRIREVPPFTAAALRYGGWPMRKRWKERDPGAAVSPGAGRADPRAPVPVGPVQPAVDHPPVPAQRDHRQDPLNGSAKENGRGGIPPRPPRAVRIGLFAGIQALVTFEAWAPFGPLRDLELDLVPFGEALEALRLDGAEVDKHIRPSVFLGDESETLRVVEPLHGAFCQNSLQKFVLAQPRRQGPNRPEPQV
jgi:hypothetical protein